MGDIAFLLIIFFMVCSNFAKESGINLSPPNFPDLEELKQTAVQVSIDEGGQIYLNGQTVDSKGIEYGVMALLEGESNAAHRVVLFKCDRTCDKAVFEPVIEAISKGGGVIAAMGEEK